MALVIIVSFLGFLTLLGIFFGIKSVAMNLTLKLFRKAFID